MKTIKVIEGEYPNLEAVNVEITETIEVSTPVVVNEQSLLNTIAYLEQQKLDYCAAKDVEIAFNKAQLEDVRSVKREEFVQTEK